jgi:hypothetical protein
MAHKGMNTIDWIAFVLVVIGGLNWGFAVFDFNLVTTIFGLGTLTKIVYALVGLSALYSIIKIAKH